MPHQYVYRKLYSIVAERYLGVETTGSVRIPAGAVMIPYIPIPYRAIFPILSRLALGPDDVFVDVGCGKGRMVCCAARWPARKVIGIDYEKALVEKAAKNAERVRGRRAEVECIHSSAQDFDYRDATVIYLYHPFERPIVDHFLARLKATRRQDRPLRIVYANSVHNAAFEEAGWLVKDEEWAENRFGGFPHRVTFWRSCD